MTAPALLSDTEVTAALAEASLDGWEREGDRLRATFRFADFVAAFSFMTAIAIHAERLNHHPEWSNVYNRVTIELTTHDSGGISAYDLELARLATALAPSGGSD